MTKGADDDRRISRLPVRFRRARAPARGRVPSGKLAVVITYLEMHASPVHAPVPHRGEKLALLRAEGCTVSYYRFLYETVGGPWLWYERRRLDDDALRAVIHDENVGIYVLYVAGVPAGYAELDARVEGEVELAYFGLMPEFIGRGLGRYFLDWAIDEAWRRHPDRIWVHTCNLDHPAAIAVYQRAGFVPYGQETVIVDDPRKPGFLPEGREFR